jgi:hypothetical protein
MNAKYVGGSMDGKSRENVALARFHLVAVQKQTTAHVDDFRLIDLDVVYGHKARREYELERYRRVSFDHATDTATYKYDGMERR